MRPLKIQGIRGNWDSHITNDVTQKDMVDNPHVVMRNGVYVNIHEHNLRKQPKHRGVNKRFKKAIKGVKL